jgi:hypothetical protein
VARETTRDFGRASLYGRRVEEDDFDPDLVGRIGPLVTATNDVLAFVRRHAAEIPDEDLARQDDGSFAHQKTGTRYEVVTSFIDWPTEQDQTTA